MPTLQSPSSDPKANGRCSVGSLKRAKNRSMVEQEEESEEVNSNINLILISNINLIFIATINLTLNIFIVTMFRWHKTGKTGELYQA